MRKIFLLMIILVSIPLLVTNFFYSFDYKKREYGTISNEKNKTINVRVLKSDNSIININLEEYLIGVLAGEMPLSFEEEALKAQAVAARTYALKQMEQNKEMSYDVTDNTSSQVYLSNDILQNRWGDSYKEKYDKIKSIIDSTKGEYISYGDDIIYAFFFSTSNGYTEDNRNVFGMDLPYLRSVDSSFEEEETDIYRINTLTKEEFYSKLGIDFNEELCITDINRSESNRVLSLSINGISFKGRDFQKKLSLRSNDFIIEEKNNEIVITTKGFGHGVGMSQYGANALAKKNKTYKEILKYYYTGTEIKKL